MKDDQFLKEINQSYSSDNALYLGNAVYQSSITDAKVSLPFRTLNRHGLVSGATGTGKTKTLQHIIEVASQNSVPTFIMDMKGDISGLAFGGKSEAWALDKANALGSKYIPTSCPVEFLAFNDGPETLLKLSLSEIGPRIVSKILGLTDTQSSILTTLFAYAKDNKIELHSLLQLRELLTFALGEGRDQIQNAYGAVTKESALVLQRKMLEISSTNAANIFGSPSFDVADLCQTRGGKGVINILRAMPLMQDPKLLGSCMLGLLSELYEDFEELGDTDKPKLIFVIDEAHMLFVDASQELISKIEMMVKLIRSKGVSIIFCTQNPADIPEDVLGQLGFKICHALRAFTAKDRKEIKEASENLPMSDYYDVSNEITSLPIGHAFVTALSDKGVPTMLVECAVYPPQSRMDTIDGTELAIIMKNSTLKQKYLSSSETKTPQLTTDQTDFQIPPMQNKTTTVKSLKTKSIAGEILESKLMRDVGKTVAKEAVKALFSVLLGKKRK